MNETNRPLDAQPLQSAQGQNMKIDDKAVKKIIGTALGKVEGVLGVEGGLTDMLKSSDDVTKGIAVTMAEDNRCDVMVKMVTEYGKNIPDIVARATDAINGALKSVAGIATSQVQIEVTDTMTKEEYQQKSKGMFSS